MCIRDRAVTATSSSYGGLITVMIGIDQDGKVTGVTVTEHADTPGLGTKAMTEEYLAGYKGKDALEEDNIKNDSGVDLSLIHISRFFFRRAYTFRRWASAGRRQGGLKLSFPRRFGRQARRQSPWAHAGKADPEPENGRRICSNFR